jgi:hypothetical protein
MHMDKNKYSQKIGWVAHVINPEQVNVNIEII